MRIASSIENGIWRFYDTVKPNYVLSNRLILPSTVSWCSQRIKGRHRGRSPCQCCRRFPVCSRLQFL